MIILWSKHPTNDIPLTRSRFTSTRGEIHFRKPWEFYIYYDTTGYLYSDEDGLGANPNRSALSNTIVKMFII